MQIGFDAKRAFCNRSGLGNYARATIRNIMEFYPDESYYLFTPDIKLHDFEYEVTGIAQIVRPQGMHKYCTPLWRSKAMSADWRKYNINIYHGLSNELPVRRNKTRCVVTIHDVIFLRYPHYYNPVDRQIYFRKTKYACENADAIVAVSEQTKEDLVEFLNVDPDKISVIYQDCSDAFARHIPTAKALEVKQRYGLPQDYMIAVGTIEERKNQLAILKALDHLDERPHIVFVGKSTAYKKKLKRFMKTFRLDKYVTFLENVPDEDLPALYRSANGFLYVSAFEGFGIPLLEAMKSEVPVITSSVSCLPETAGDAALLVDPSKPEEIADAIQKINTDEDICNELVKKGREQLKKFEPEKNISRLMQLYQSVI